MPVILTRFTFSAVPSNSPQIYKLISWLTNLYNERPTWLRLAHRALDEAVIAAYAHADPEGGWAPSWAEVFVDTGAGQPLPEGHPLAERRAEVEQLILGALLRLNHERAEPDLLS